jgi:predicted dehydrogenase
MAYMEDNAVNIKTQTVHKNGRSKGRDAIKIGVIGYGYWGPNIVRNFTGSEYGSVSMVCDSNPDSLTKVIKNYPQMLVTCDSDDIMLSADIDAVAVITPVSSHFDLAKKALLNGKHIFVEKPFTATSAQAEELIDLAEKKGLKIMVDHTFIFTGSVRKMKQLVDDGVLGSILYYDSIRVNLGLFQHDCNVIWDLAPHDFAIMDYLISDKPIAISACGKSHFNCKENIAFVTAHFANNIVAHFSVNWLSPVKVRLTMLGGEKKMVVWNDSLADEKIKVYDKGVEILSKDGIYDLLVSYRSGDMLVPKIEQTEALKMEADYFIRCIHDNVTPINDGHAGLRIVKMLEACDKSLQKQGELAYL